MEFRCASPTWPRSLLVALRLRVHASFPEGGWVVSSAPRTWRNYTTSALLVPLLFRISIVWRSTGVTEMRNCDWFFEIGICHSINNNSTTCYRRSPMGNPGNGSKQTRLGCFLATFPRTRVLMQKRINTRLESSETCFVFLVDFQILTVAASSSESSSTSPHLRALLFQKNKSCLWCITTSPPKTKNMAILFRFLKQHFFKRKKAIIALASF